MDIGLKTMALEAYKSEREEQRIEDERQHSKQIARLLEKIKNIIPIEFQYKSVRVNGKSGISFDGHIGFVIYEQYQRYGNNTLDTCFINGETKSQDGKTCPTRINTLADIGKAITWYEANVPVIKSNKLNRFAELKVDEANEETRSFVVLGVTHDPGDWSYLVVEYTDIGEIG